MTAPMSAERLAALRDYGFRYGDIAVNELVAEVERLRPALDRVIKWAGHQPVMLTDYGTGYSQAQQHAHDLATDAP